MTNLELFNKSRLPETIQTEASECGLACLTMIAVYHGHDVDLRSMRARSPVSLKGMTVDSLISVAEKLDLGARALRLDIKKINKLTLPSILHWDLNHFVVLKAVKRNYVEIHDPARGFVRVNKEEFSEHFTGIALEIYPTATFKKQTLRSKVSFSSLWDKLVGLKRAITHTFLLSLLMQLSVILSPFYLQLVMDEAILKFDINFLLVLALGFGFLAVFRAITTAMRSWTILYYGNQAGFQLIANIFQHLMYLPVSFFEKRHVGDVLSRIGSANPIQNALTQSVVSAFIDGLMAIITGVVIFAYSTKLGAIVLVSILLVLIVNLSFYPFIRRKQEETIICDAKKESFEIECIKAISTIKLYGAQPNRLSNWRNLFVADINASVSMSRHQIILSTINDVITSLQAILIVYFAAKLVIDNQVEFSVGMLVAFMSYRQYFTDSIVSLMEKMIEFRLLSLHLERIAEITETEIEERGHSSEEHELESHNDTYIEFRDVYFRFSSNDPWILCGVNLKINKGDFIVLSGDSGGGKTTLVKLLLGLYKPTRGEIIINGSLLTDSVSANWRKKVGVVMQDDQLLTGTIVDNISFFDGELDMAKVYKAARFACIHDVISAMPMKYLSYIGDMGSMLSAGQKQRVLLARAMYREPEALLLDEGTVNIDKGREEMIINSIGQLNSTRLVVSHSDAFSGQIHRNLQLVAGRVIEKNIPIV